MSPACTGYNEEKEFIFISKNSDGDDYHLNTVTSDQTTYSQPLTNITGYPSDKNVIFNGLCSYSKSLSAFYLSFNSNVVRTLPVININGTNSISSTSYNTTLATIYQLNYATGQSSNQFYPTAIQLQNTTLISFAPFIDANHTTNLAYISTKNNNEYSLGLTNLKNSTYSTTTSISGNGILAAGGSQSQHLYLIQNSSIIAYRLETMDYTTINIETNISSIKSGTTGQVYINNRTLAGEYVSIFNSDSAEMNLFYHNTSLSKFTPLTWSNGYVDLGNKNTTPANKNDTSIPITMTKTAFVTSSKATPSLHSYSASSTRSASDSAPTVLNRKPAPHKRDLKPQGNPITSSDGSVNYQNSIITNTDGSPILAAMLSDASEANQDLPYNIQLLSGDDINGYRQNALSSSGLAPPMNSVADGGINKGVIAGIVIGTLMSLALIFALLCFARKRKHHSIKTRECFPSSMSVYPEDFVTPFGHNLEKKDDNHSNTSSILQEAINVPEEYHDDNRPDIRPLCYNKDKIEYASPSRDELALLEPDVRDPLFLFSGQYTSPANEKVTYLKEGYAVRTFDSRDGTKHTVHYFTSANLNTFVRSVYAVKQCALQPKKAENYLMRNNMAIVLSKPTPLFKYQFIWITSPMIPEQSLYHLIYEKKAWAYNVDRHNMDYKIWSIYIILKNVEQAHSHRIRHLAIDLKAFYYDHESKVTEWRLGNFGYARNSLKIKRYTAVAPHSAYTAPEIINNKDHAFKQAADVWSTGCVIYAVATGGLALFQNDFQVKDLATFKNDLEQHIRVAIRDNIENSTFKDILELMLRVDPEERKSITQVLELWDTVYNMEG